MQMLRLIPLLPVLLATACTPGNRLVQPVDRTEPGENAELWQPASRGTLRFVPRGWPARRTGPRDGQWLTDPQDGAAFFVPATEYGGKSPGVWKGEARKHLNLYSKSEQGRRNLATLLVGLPLEAAGWTIVGMAGAYSGGMGSGCH